MKAAQKRRSARSLTKCTIGKMVPDLGVSARYENAVYFNVQGLSLWSIKTLSAIPYFSKTWSENTP